MHCRSCRRMRLIECLTELAERVESYAGGMELANGFETLNLPVQQLGAFGVVVEEGTEADDDCRYPPQVCIPFR